MILICLIFIPIAHQTQIFINNRANSTTQNGTESFPYTNLDQLWKSKNQITDLEIILFNNYVEYALFKYEFANDYNIRIRWKEEKAFLFFSF